MSNKAAARGTIQMTLARFCFLASGYVISVVLARGLGPAAYGVYGVVMSLLLWVEMVNGAGLKGATAQLLPQQVPRAEEIEQTARALLLIIAFAFLGICWAVADPVARMLDLPQGAKLLRFAVLDLPFNGLYLAYQGILFAHRRYAVLSISMVVYAFTKLAGMLLLLAWGLSVTGALIVNVIATVGVLVYLTIRFPPRGWRPTREFIRPMMRLGIVMGACVMILQILLSLDLWFLQALWQGPAETIGYYTAALNIARLPTVVPSVLTGVLFTSLAWAFAQNDEALARRYLRAAMRFATVVLVPGCVLAVMFAEPIMALLYSDTYRGGGVYLKLQVVAFVAMAYLDLLLSALMARHRHAVAVGILAGLVPLAVAANLLLIPRFGAVGAAVSLLATIGIGTAVAMVCTYRYFGALVHAATLYRVAFASVCMALVGVFVAAPPMWLIPKLAALAAVYGICLFATKEIQIAELRSFALLKGDR